MAESHSTFSEIGSPNQNQSLEQATENGALNGAVNGDDHGYSGSSLSMDFSAPLSGQARNERVKQIANNHPAYAKMRSVQEILYKVQTTLRRMPGVSASESEEINEQLQGVSQIISQETSQLIDAIANLTLDNEQTGKHFARMTIEQNLIKVDAEDKNDTILHLKSELGVEREKHKEADLEMKRTMEEFNELSKEFHNFKLKVRNNTGSPGSQEDLVKSFEAIIQHLEDQVNNRRSLWVMKHSDPQMIAKAIETMADSVPDKGTIARSLSALRAAGSFGANGHHEQDANMSADENHRENHNRSVKPWARSNNEFGPHTTPARTPSAFQQQHPERPPTAQSHLFSPIQAGPPRASSTRAAGSRPFQGWGNSNGAAVAQNRAVSTSNTLVSPSQFRPTSRRGFQAQTRYRGGGGGGHHQEFRPSIFAENPIQRPSTGFGHSRDVLSHNGGGPSRQQWSGRALEYESGRNNHINGSQNHNNSHNHHHHQQQQQQQQLFQPNGPPGPLIHLPDRAVAGWSQNIASFYTIIRKFVDGFASHPIRGDSEFLKGTHLWPILMRTYAPLDENQASAYLDIHLADQNAKRCLVTRVVIDYVVNLVWVPSAWKGANDKLSIALREVEGQLAETIGLPSSARQPLLDRQAAILDDIMKICEPHCDFYKTKLEEIAGSLLTSLEPLLNDYINPADAYVSLLSVAEQAWDLSSKILTSRLTFDFRFPEIGSRFSSQSMVSIWPADVEPLELQARHWRVAMVTTPVITCRNDTGSNISAHSVALADVICMM